ncbi:hypothetical protein C8R46DRAFT_1351880 [Mycena filopes]|nr:hypothetical protein C8R46DRAFT_1351880 [Mycena filopes]
MSRSRRHFPYDKTERPVSTFVICMPRGSSRRKILSSFTAQDARAFEDALPTGGTAYSTHHPKEALTWVESHYNDRVVVSIRSRGLGGPLATMIGPEMQGLAIFGSITKKYVLRAAHTLADASGYPVIIQPRSDDPLLVWGTPVTPGSGEEPTTTESGDGVGNDGGVMRTPTGDKPLDEYTSWIGPVHSSNIHLKLCGMSTVDYDIDIALETQFMVESRIKRHNVRNNRPPVISRTHLSVSSDGGQVLPARSYSNIGFISTLAWMSWFESRFDRQTNFMKAELITTSFLRLVLHCLSAQIKYRKTKAIPVENHENSDATPWTASHTPGPVRELPGPEYTEYYSWNIAYDTHTHTKTRDPLEVVFSMGVDPMDENDPQNLMPPAGPFINRNQTIIWVANKQLRTKGFGMIIATTLYFPSYLTRTPISTTQRATIDLRDTSPPAGEEERDTGMHLKKILSLLPLFSSVLYHIKNLDVNFDDSDYIEPRGWVVGQDHWLFPIYPAVDEQTLSC